MSLSFRQIGLRSRMTARLAVDPSIYGNISGNGSDLGYPKGKPEKLTVYRRWYQKPGTLAFGKNVKEMLGSAEFGIIPENGVGVITKEAIIAEFNSRNVFSTTTIPQITSEQAVIMAVCRALQYRGRPLIFANPYYVDKEWWNRAVTSALDYAEEKTGTQSVYGVDVWKYRSPRKASGYAYYRDAVYPYRDSSLVRTPGTKIVKGWYN